MVPEIQTRPEGRIDISRYLRDTSVDLGEVRARRDTARTRSQEIRDLALQATRGGAEGFFNLLDEYVLCDNRDFRGPDVEDVVLGRESVIQQYVRWWGAFDEYSVRAREVTSSGRTAVVLIEERGQGKSRTVPLVAEHSQVWTFRRGRIIHIELFRDHPRALEAVGLSE